MIAPEPVEEESPVEQNGAENPPTVRGGIIISADTVDDIAGEDYDRAYQQMIDNALA